jgi:cytochrome c oxidase assembly factor CtaG
MRGLMMRARPWLAVLAVALILVLLLPPVGTYARQSAAIQALQFVFFAAVVPALAMIGAPALRELVVGRRAGAAGGRPPVQRAVARVLTLIAVAVVWRLPPVASALARDPALAVAEMITLVGAGSLVWSEITAPVGVPHTNQRFPRGAMAAVSMWTMWAIAYVTGMSKFSMLPASVHTMAGGLSVADDRQLAVAVMWLVPALCYVPVVFVMILSWIRDSEDPNRDLTTGDLAYAGQRGMPRPPRGWR